MSYFPSNNLKQHTLKLYLKTHIVLTRNRNKNTHVYCKLNGDTCNTVHSRSFFLVKLEHFHTIRHPWFKQFVAIQCNAILATPPHIGRVFFLNCSYWESLDVERNIYIFIRDATNMTTKFNTQKEEEKKYEMRFGIIKKIPCWWW